MALLTVAHTFPQIQRVTRRNVLERVLLEWGLGMYGTATGGSTSTIVDTTKLKSTQYTARDWNNAIARISKDAGGAGAAPEGEISPVTDFAPSTGTITNNPVFTAAVASGDIYQLWKYPHPQDVIDLLTILLTKELEWPCWSVLSELPDFDMEQSGITHWGTAVNATAAKDTAEPLLGGTQHMKVTGSGAAIDNYLPTVSLRVTPGKNYRASALVRANATTSAAKLVIYDETNGAALVAASTTSLDVVRLTAQAQIPATCRTVTVRLQNAAVAGISYFDAVTFHNTEATDLALPWWVKNRNQVKGLYSLRSYGAESASAAATEILDPALSGREISDWDVRADSFGRGQLRIFRRGGGSIGNGPLFIFGTRYETAFADEDTTVKHVDENLVAAALAAKVWERLAASNAAGDLDKMFIREQRERAYAEWHRLAYDLEESIEATLRSPILDAPAMSLRDW